MIKRNTNVKSLVAIRRRIAVAVSLLVIAAAACSGLAIGGGALSAIWREQFRVQDSAIDVVVTSSGKNVKPDTIIYYFGLTNGANLATIPYEDLRKGLIARIPNIKDIKVERRLPRRVTVDVKEREPAVRIAPAKGAPNSGLVADYDGVVFRTFNSPPLPIIREAAEKRHDPGQKLEGNAGSALRLVHLLAEAADAKSDEAPELSELRVLEVDTSKKDYLLVTLGDYSMAEIAWERMHEDSEVSRKSLRRQLLHLAQAIATRLTPRTTRWIATEYEKGGRVYATDPARLGGR